MSHEFDLLEQRIVNLEKAWANLASSLAAAVDFLKSNQLPPSDALAEEIYRLRREHADIQNAILRLDLDISGQVRPEDLLPLSDLRQRFDTILQLYRRTDDIRRHATQVLSRILELRHREFPEFAPLLECQARARELRNQIEESPMNRQMLDIFEFSDDANPWIALVSLVEGHDDLDDEVWARRRDLVAEFFGKALEIAVSRAKIVSLTASTNQVVELPPALSPIPEDKTEVQQQIEVTEVPAQDPIEGAEVLIGAQENEPDTKPIAKEEDKKEEDKEEVDIKGNGASPPLPLHEGDQLVDEPAQATTVDSASQSIVVISKFLREDTAQRIAQSALVDEQKDLGPNLRDLIWRLIHENRSGLAYHLAIQVSRLFPDLQPQLPSWLIRALTLSRHVRFEGGEIAHLLMEDYQHFSDQSFSKLHVDWNHALRFLIAAASLRPAILAPNTGASALLHSLRMKDGLRKTYELCQVVANYGDQHQALDVVSLQRASDQASWQGELERLQREVEVWSAQASGLSMIYGPATKVWSAWQEPGGLIDSLLAPIRHQDATRLEEVKSDVARLSDGSRIAYEVKRTDKRLRGARVGDGITAKALNRMREHVREAVNFANRWIALQESHPVQKSTFLNQQAELLRSEIHRLQPLVLAELQAFEERSPFVFLYSAISTFRSAVDDLRNLFVGEAMLPESEPMPGDLLNADLLHLPTIPLKPDWQPEVDQPHQLISDILQLIGDNRFDWVQSFQARRDARDFEGTQQIIEYLTRHPDPSIDLPGLQSAHEKGLRECRLALERDCSQTRTRIEEAVALGLLPEQERLKYASQREEIELGIPHTYRFIPCHLELERIRQEIGQRKEAGVQEMRKQLAGLELDDEHPTLKRINAVLDRGDVLTANEYVRIAQSGCDIPEDEASGTVFERFFPLKFREIMEFLESAQWSRPDRWVDEIRHFAHGHQRNLSLGPVDMNSVAGQQAQQAADLIQTWFTVKKVRRIDVEQIKLISKFLGFDPVEVVRDPSKQRAWFNMRTIPIADRNRIPVAAYGSAADGRYRVLCVWDRLTEEDLLSEVGETINHRPAIVFYFARLTEQRRRDLARLCRARRRTFIVVDDVLAIYLCGERGSRLPVLFECTLPFTFLEPYTITSSVVPPEMFFGRERERDLILDRFGSCFIYGGRQLGKTVLLRDVARRFHGSVEGKIALWVDLKSAGIGITQPINDIWRILADEFKKLKVIPANVPSHAGAEKILSHIENWLNQDTERRVLLLLDEADRFLEIDGKPVRKDTHTRERHDEADRFSGSDKGPEQGQFVLSAKLKGLMERTDRRFKVVFTGLHNVQRTTRLENHPLAHFGEPICIGPLIDNGEMREARALIEKPLGCLGYRFESMDLVFRILSQTNYYPSLIQLYCNELLKHVTVPYRASFDPKSCPPYIITSRQVSEAYQSNDLQKAISERFRLTLDLDKRYRVIAYALALYSDPLKRGSHEEGFSVSWIRETATLFWAAGFQDMPSEHSFRVLLDEMVGLGVLRTLENGHYVLRSPNVGILMGTRNEIEAELLSAESFEAPIAYEATTLRSSYGSDHSRRSPLTVQQESELRSRRNGVSLVVGCDMAGLADLESFLSVANGPEYLISLSSISDRTHFRRSLGQLRKREGHGTTIALVPPSCPWCEEWIDDASEMIKQLRSKTSFVRVVFVADPNTLWQLLGTSRELPQTIPTINLAPWHDLALRQWLDDCNYPSDQNVRQQITAVTGNWPNLLQEFRLRSQANPHLWKRDLDELNSVIDDAVRRKQLLRDFGLLRTEVRTVLQDLALDEEASTEDLYGIVQGVPPEIIDRTLHWANLLCLISPNGVGYRRLDPLVKRLLLAE